MGMEQTSFYASVTSAPLLTVFKRQLKTFLFDNFFNDYVNYVPCLRSYLLMAR